MIRFIKRILKWLTSISFTQRVNVSKSDQICFAGFVNTLQAALPTFLELWKDLQSVTDEDYKFFLALVHSNPESPIPAQQVLASGDILSTEERQIFIVALREWVAKQPKEFQGTSLAHLIVLFFYVDANYYLYSSICRLCFSRSRGSAQGPCTDLSWELAGRCNGIHNDDCWTKRHWQELLSKRNS